MPLPKLKTGNPEEFGNTLLKIRALENQDKEVKMRADALKLKQDEVPSLINERESQYALRVLQTKKAAEDMKVTEETRKAIKLKNIATSLSWIAGRPDPEVAYQDYYAHIAETAPEDLPSVVSPDAFFKPNDKGGFDFDRKELKKYAMNGVNAVNLASSNKPFSVVVPNPEFGKETDQYKTKFIKKEFGADKELLGTSATTSPDLSETERLKADKRAEDVARRAERDLTERERHNRAIEGKTSNKATLKKGISGETYRVASNGDIFAMNKETGDWEAATPEQVKDVQIGKAPAEGEFSALVKKGGKDKDKNKKVTEESLRATLKVGGADDTYIDSYVAKAKAAGKL